MPVTPIASKRNSTAGASAPNEIVVFWIVRDSTCAECGEALGKGRFLRLEAQRPLCLSCADLDHLVFLERGDPALTRRASKYSTLRAVVVRFSRSRKRYDALLSRGVERSEARSIVAEAVAKQLEQWQRRDQFSDGRSM